MATRRSARTSAAGEFSQYYFDSDESDSEETPLQNQEADDDTDAEGFDNEDIDSDSLENPQTTSSNDRLYRSIISFEFQFLVKSYHEYLI